MIRAICLACQYGHHEDCHKIRYHYDNHNIIFGGEECPCGGECGDGRYYPKQIELAQKALNDFLEAEKEIK